MFIFFLIKIGFLSIDPTEKLEKIRKNSREKDHASSVGQEDDLFSLTELLKQNANHVENIE